MLRYTQKNKEMIQVDFQIPKKERSWGARIFMAVGLAILVVLVSGIVWLMYNHYSYQQYQIRLEYVLGGQTSTVETVDQSGNRCVLSSVNRRALYSFLSDSSGKRLPVCPGKKTGQYINFHAESAVGEADGTVSEVSGDFVGISFTYEGKTWKFYCQNRSVYEYYQRVVSPDGWVEPNTEYYPAESQQEG